MLRLSCGIEDSGTIGCFIGKCAHYSINYTCGHIRFILLPSGQRRPDQERRRSDTSVERQNRCCNLSREGGIIPEGGRTFNSSSCIDERERDSLRREDSV